MRKCAKAVLQRSSAKWSTKNEACHTTPVPWTATARQHSNACPTRIILPFVIISAKSQLTEWLSAAYAAEKIDDLAGMIAKSSNGLLFHGDKSRIAPRPELCPSGALIKEEQMKVVTEYELAKSAISNSEPCFYAHFKDNLFERTVIDGQFQYAFGRRYPGLFDAFDGSYITLTKDPHGAVRIDRDSYAAIPVFYSTTRPIVSTDLRLIVDTRKPRLDSQALREYLSTAYLTGGKTIYENIRSLMPNQFLTFDERTLRPESKTIFPDLANRTEADVSALLDQALSNSIQDLLKRFPGTIVFNLSGGTDSTLLLAKIREKDRHKQIVSTTYFHEDWRDDLNDWEYANQAAQSFGSKHHLTRINNASFCAGHRELVHRAKNVFHTYAAAFYVQSQILNELGPDVPIVNGSGPDESMIGTEKIAVKDLLSLKDKGRDEWLDYLIANIDYIKLPESTVSEMVRGQGPGFVQTRRAVAADLLDAPDFVEFQRRFHAVTVLQDHIHELTSVAQVLDHPIIFPYLTNDIFRIVFSSSFETLNARSIYKSAVKNILEKYMPRDFVHRRKIGFQSPSRPYFKSNEGLGRELSRLLSKGKSTLLNLDVVGPGIQARLNAELDLHRRYDFLEWTAYNLLLFEEDQEVHCA